MIVLYIKNYLLHELNQKAIGRNIIEGFCGKMDFLFIFSFIKFLTYLS